MRRSHTRTPISNTQTTHDEGTLYAKQAYSQTFVCHTHVPHPNAIHKLMNIVRKSNIIRFADKCYLQIQAMGTKMAPSYANLFMGKIEQLTHPKVHCWKRFINGIFVILTDTEPELENYVARITQLHNTIKFTYEANPNQIQFLDTIVYKDTDHQQTHKLKVKTYIKTTTKHLYVPADSFHPQRSSHG